jgi:hypothetical protein
VKSHFEGIFKTSNHARDKYLSRLFGLFSEEVVLNWCICLAAPYENLGRPTLWVNGKRGSTLDFTLRRRATGEVFVAEMKCWTELDNYRYLRLIDSEQLQRAVDQKFAGNAFQEFLLFSKDQSAFEVQVNGRALPTQADGAILIWGATSDSGRSAAIAEYNFGDVLSTETMLDDLQSWKPTQWAERVDELRQWSDELFRYLHY